MFHYTPKLDPQVAGEFNRFNKFLNRFAFIQFESKQPKVESKQPKVESKQSFQEKLKIKEALLLPYSQKRAFKIRGKTNLFT